MALPTPSFYDSMIPLLDCRIKAKSDLECLCLCSATLYLGGTYDYAHCLHHKDLDIYHVTEVASYEITEMGPGDSILQEGGK